MTRYWMTLSALVWCCACGHSRGAPPFADSGEKACLSSTAGAEKVLAPGITTQGSSPPACSRDASAQPKTVIGDLSVSETAEPGRALILEVAAIAIELPACTALSDRQVMTVSWEMKHRPRPGRIDPEFKGYGATLRVDRNVAAPDGSPLLVRLRSTHDLKKPGEKFVLAVEKAGACDRRHREELAPGACAHWALYEAAFDARNNEMVARVGALGGHRLQFGWVPFE